MNLDNSLRPPSPVQTSRPITQAEYNTLEAAVLKDVSEYYRREIAPKKAELEAKQAELQTRKVELQAKAAFVDKEIAEARDMKARGQEMQARGQEMQARGRQGLEIVAQKREEIAQDKQAIAQDKQAIAQETRDYLADMFYAIFKKNPLTAEQKQAIYNTYVANMELLLDKSHDGKSYLRLSSMKSVIKFLDDPENSAIKTCDFRHFKDKIGDVDTLAEYLSRPTCRITSLAVKEFISADVRASLAKAEAARSGFVVKTFK